MMQKEKIIFLVGPTAIGKTQIAIQLAQRLNAEIISCDSKQIYKRMDILTSKLAPRLRKKIPHHLVDIISPEQEYDVYHYRKDALRKIKAILKKGKVPLFVGGTGLYASILIQGIFKAAAKNEAIRKRLYQQAEKRGSLYLYIRLRDIDPEAASKIHPNDARRIIRALEVFENTGKPISFLQRQRSGLNDKYDVRIFCLNMEREILYRRVEERVEEMFRQGVLLEVKRLLRSKLSKTASCAIGIRELKGYFAGLYDLEEAKRLMRRNTRAYAKRQLTWFRSQRGMKWINIGDKEKPQDVADRIYRDC